MPQPASFPDVANYTWRTLAEGLQRPTDIQNAGDGSGRLFIVEQHGRIQLDAVFEGVLLTLIQFDKL